MRLEIVIETYVNMAVAIGVKETVEVAELLYLEWGKKTGEVSVVKPVICEPPVGNKVDFWTKRGTHPSTAATHTLSPPASSETWLRRGYRQKQIQVQVRVSPGLVLRKYFIVIRSRLTGATQ